jgi:aryl-alcohol dehydrogenase-like predicted oxidoreductase
MNNRLILGTAQFGMDYGINNKSGKVFKADALEILHKAVNYGIDTFDTAYTYGESEEILGEFIESCAKKPKIISKLPSCNAGEVREILKSSLRKLNDNAIYGYLIHGFKDYFKDGKIWDELEKLKSEGKIKKIGFSLYLASEIEHILKHDLKIDIIQVPFSIFDQRFKAYFPGLKKRNIEVCVRSVFMQGLVFKKPCELDSYFKSIKGNVEKLNILSQESGIPIFALCLNFALRNDFIDRVVVGIDNISHLNETIQALSGFSESKDDVFDSLSKLEVKDENIILPFKWPEYKTVI